MRIVWEIVRRITYEILGVKGVNSVLVYVPDIFLIYWYLVIMLLIPFLSKAVHLSAHKHALLLKIKIPHTNPNKLVPFPFKTEKVFFLNQERHLLVLNPSVLLFRQ